MVNLPTSFASDGNISTPMPMANDITRVAAERQCQKVLNDMKVETGLLGKVLAFIRGREGGYSLLGANS